MVLVKKNNTKNKVKRILTVVAAINVWVYKSFFISPTITIKAKVKKVSMHINKNITQNFGTSQSGCKLLTTIAGTANSTAKNKNERMVKVNFNFLGI